MLTSSSGCTVVSDGWDDIEKNHLINLLYCTAGASFFDGTTQLTSEVCEDADSVSNFLIESIDRLGDGAAVVQVCTDTCAVMKAAWKSVEKQRPWVSCTCCAPHVLSLLLKDIGKIAQVADVIAKMQKILKRFWGRSRWPRLKLKEVAIRNHGRRLGLYRAAPTRFAGKVCLAACGPAT